MFAHAKFAITMLVYFFNVTLWFLDTFFKSMDFLGMQRYYNSMCYP